MLPHAFKPFFAVFFKLLAIYSKIFTLLPRLGFFNQPNFRGVVCDPPAKIATTNPFSNTLLRK
jgi:hypothetical protein